MIRALAVLGLAAFLSACSSDQPDASGITPSEARQLNAAAVMLDANSVDAAALTANDATTGK